MVIFIQRNVLTYRKRARCITCCRPSPATVEAKAFVANDCNQPTSSKSFWVRLSLDLQHVEGQYDDLADANDTTSGSMHNSLPVSLSECAVERTTMVFRQVVPHKRLSTIFVHTLKDLVSRQPNVPSEPSSIMYFISCRIS